MLYPCSLGGNTGKGGSLGSEGPEFESQDCRGWITSLKTEPDAPRSEGKWAGVIHDPCHFVTCTYWRMMRKTMCHYVATGKYIYGKSPWGPPPLERPRRDTHGRNLRYAIFWTVGDRAKRTPDSVSDWLTILGCTCNSSTIICKWGATLYRTITHELHIISTWGLHHEKAYGKGNMITP